MVSLIQPISSPTPALNSPLSGSLLNLKQATELNLKQANDLLTAVETPLLFKIDKPIQYTSNFSLRTLVLEFQRLLNSYQLRLSDFCVFGNTLENALRGKQNNKKVMQFVGTAFLGAYTPADIKRLYLEALTKSIGLQTVKQQEGLGYFDPKHQPIGFIPYDKGPDFSNLFEMPNKRVLKNLWCNETCLFSTIPLISSEQESVHIDIQINREGKDFPPSCVTSRECRQCNLLDYFNNRLDLPLQITSMKGYELKEADSLSKQNRCFVNPIWAHSIQNAIFPYIESITKDSLPIDFRGEEIYFENWKKKYENDPDRYFYDLQGYLQTHLSSPEEILVYIQTLYSVFSIYEFKGKEKFLSDFDSKIANQVPAFFLLRPFMFWNALKKEPIQSTGQIQWKRYFFTPILEKDLKIFATLPWKETLAVLEMPEAEIHKKFNDISSFLSQIRCEFQKLQNIRVFFCGRFSLFPKEPKIELLQLLASSEPINPKKFIDLWMSLPQFDPEDLSKIKKIIQTHHSELKELLFILEFSHTPDPLKFVEICLEKNLPLAQHIFSNLWPTIQSKIEVAKILAFVLSHPQLLHAESKVWLDQQFVQTSEKLGPLWFDYWLKNSHSISIDLYSSFLQYSGFNLDQKKELTKKVLSEFYEEKNFDGFFHCWMQACEKNCFPQEALAYLSSILEKKSAEHATTCLKAIQALCKLSTPIENYLNQIPIDWLKLDEISKNKELLDSLLSKADLTKISLDSLHKFLKNDLHLSQEVFSKLLEVAFDSIKYKKLFMQNLPDFLGRLDSLSDRLKGKWKQLLKTHQTWDLSSLLSLAKLPSLVFSLEEIWGKAVQKIPLTKKNLPLFIELTTTLQKQFQGPIEKIDTYWKNQISNQPQVFASCISYLLEKNDLPPPLLIHVAQLAFKTNHPKAVEFVEKTLPWLNQAPLALIWPIFILLNNELGPNMKEKKQQLLKIGIERIRNHQKPEENLRFLLELKDIPYEPELFFKNLDCLQDRSAENLWKILSVIFKKGIQVRLALGEKIIPLLLNQISLEASTEKAVFLLHDFLQAIKPRACPKEVFHCFENIQHKSKEKIFKYPGAKEVWEKMIQDLDQWASADEKKELLSALSTQGYQFLKAKKIVNPEVLMTLVLQMEKVGLEGSKNLLYQHLETYIDSINTTKDPQTIETWKKIWAQLSKVSLSLEDCAFLFSLYHMAFEVVFQGNDSCGALHTLQACILKSLNEFLKNKPNTLVNSQEEKELAPHQKDAALSQAIISFNHQAMQYLLLPKNQENPIIGVSFYNQEEHGIANNIPLNHNQQIVLKIINQSEMLLQASRVHLPHAAKYATAAVELIESAVSVIDRFHPQRIETLLVNCGACCGQIEHFKQFLEALDTVLNRSSYNINIKSTIYLNTITSLEKHPHLADNKLLATYLAFLKEK